MTVVESNSDVSERKPDTVNREIVHIPFHDDDLLAVMVDGKPHLVVKPAVEAIGLDYVAQYRKLREHSWATIASKAVVAADGRLREMVTCDVRTFLMLLATVDERRVSADVKPKLIAYQAEVADAIEAYFTKGAAINPRVTNEQRYELAAKLLGMAPAQTDPQWVDQKYRHVIAMSLGERPEVAPEDRLLTADEYLQEWGHKGKELRSLRTRLGKAVAAHYRVRHNCEPGKGDRFVDGTTRRVAVYTERDRDLFDTAYSTMVARAA